MNYLFLHNNYPAQFRALIAHLSAIPGNEVVFLTEGRRSDVHFPKVHLGLVRVQENDHASPFLLERTASKNLRRAESFAAAMQKLRARGFRPDIIYYHGGWGCGLFCGDIFPEARRLNYCEWFFDKRHPADLIQKAAQNPGVAVPAHTTNLMCLHALADCDLSIAPTQWQKDRSPREFAAKIAVVHDGINTNFFSPAGKTRSELVQVLGLPLPQEAEILTYVSRGFEPMRGFPQFFRSLPAILEARPRCHAVLMGDDAVVYNTGRPDGQTWLNALRAETPLPEGRVHILPFQAYENYRSLLRLSDLHVYLTAPFVLSWSMLEAMSTGCLLLASDTEPVREMARPGKNMILTPWDDPQTLAAQAAEALRKKEALAPLRAEARRTILDQYSLNRLLPRQLDLLHGR